MLFAYFGPETVLPITSAIAGVAGVFMMFGRQITGWAKRTARRFVRTVGGKPKAPASVPGRPAGRRVRSDAASRAGETTGR